MSAFLQGRWLRAVLFIAVVWPAGSAAAQFSGSVGALELRPFVIGLRPVVSNGSVGGVMVDAQGVLQRATIDPPGQPANQPAGAELQASRPLPAELAEGSGLRKISLRRLQESIDRHRRERIPADESMQCLAGLVAIRYIVAYPEHNDLILAGPAEAWRTDELGHVVGLSSGRPVLLLDDLLVALRSAEQASQGGISCSIDPTAEGLRSLQRLVRKSRFSSPDQATLGAIEQALGRQAITISNVPPGSHFARVLLAADYRMKRIAMNFEPAPIEGLPGYLDMAAPGRGGLKQMLPRWWLAMDCEPPRTDPGQLTWQLMPLRVKAMAEEDVLAADGSRRRTGRASTPARQWAERMTERYEELSLAAPVFGELRNVMELALAAAVITSHDLAESSNCPLDALLDPDVVQVARFEEPQWVNSQASFVRKRGNWLVSVSGGVVVDSWAAMGSPQANAELAAQRDAHRPPAPGAWWWD